MDENNGINCVDYAVIHTDKRQCDTCHNEGKDCAKLMFAGSDYICVNNVR